MRSVHTIYVPCHLHGNMWCSCRTLGLSRQKKGRRLAAGGGHSGTATEMNQPITVGYCSSLQDTRRQPADPLGIGTHVYAILADAVTDTVNVRDRKIFLSTDLCPSTENLEKRAS